MQQAEVLRNEALGATLVKKNEAAWLRSLLLC